MEKVHRHGRWVKTVSDWTFVVVVCVVNITQTAGNVATDDVVRVVAQVWVKPRGEIRIRQPEGRLVQNTVVVEGHVVDLVVRIEGKGLRTNFKTQRSRTGFGVDVTAVVVDPPKGHVPVEDVGLFLAAIEGAVKIVGGIVFQRVVAVVSVQVNERCQGVGKVSVNTVCGPCQNDLWNAAFVTGKFLAGVAVWIVLAQQPSAVEVHLLAVNDPVAIVLIANVFVDRCQAVGRERAGPKVISARAVGHGRQLELATLVQTAQPQSARKHRVAVRALGNLVTRGVQIPPHVATAHDGGTHVVQVQIRLCTRRLAQFLNGFVGTNLFARRCTNGFTGAGMAHRNETYCQGGSQKTFIQQLVHNLKTIHCLLESETNAQTNAARQREIEGAHHGDVVQIGKRLCVGGE